MMPQIPDHKYCLYARKSSESDERQAMSIESQINEMMKLSKNENLKVVEVKQESFSAKLSSSRPIFNELLYDLRAGKFNAILTWAPDRLSRNAGDLGSLVDLMDSNKLAQIRTFSQSFSNTPNEKFMLMILCSQAKLENDNRGVNVKRGIRAKCEMGWRPCMPPLGYFTRSSTGKARDVIIDDERAPFITKMFEMSANGKSGRHIKQWLIDNGVCTRKGKMIHLSMIYKILKNPFYYGNFEYPIGSGNWYHGLHDPLIGKELFQKVQMQLSVPVKSKWGSKSFPFKKFLKCATCGSTVVGEEKFKVRTDGGKNRHVYYHCSRQVKYDCPEPFAKESDIVQGLMRFSCDLITDLSEVEPGMRLAINKYKNMMLSSLPLYQEKQLLSGYIKYVLEHGSEFEKTRLVRNLKINLALHNRDVIQID